MATNALLAAKRRQGSRWWPVMKIENDFAPLGQGAADLPQ